MRHIVDKTILHSTIDNDTRLKVEIMQNETKNLYFGGTADPVSETIYPIKLYDSNDEPNMHNVSAVCALKGETISIDDAYSDLKYDFSGTKGVKLC